MNTFIWKESVTKRGADNIISCLHLDLVRRGVLSRSDKEAGQRRAPLQHLAVAADNCSGQNKNKAMLVRVCVFGLQLAMVAFLWGRSCA